MSTSSAVTAVPDFRDASYDGHNCVQECPTGVVCGTVPDGCGNEILCGSCPSESTCNDDQTGCCANNIAPKFHAACMSGNPIVINPPGGGCGTEACK